MCKSSKVSEICLLTDIGFSIILVLKRSTIQLIISNSFVLWIHLCWYTPLQYWWKSMSYNNLDNFDSLPLIIFIQKPIKRVLMVTSVGLWLSSAWSIYTGVLLFECDVSIEFILKIFNLLNVESFQMPIPQPYRAIGKTVWSNNRKIQGPDSFV